MMQRLKHEMVNARAELLPQKTLAIDRLKDRSAQLVLNGIRHLLRQRIRQVYAMQLKAKVLAILEACRQWKVRIVVFPEYSIPYDILGPISDASGEMVIVAGTHAVERERVERT